MLTVKILRYLIVFGLPNINPAESWCTFLLNWQQSYQIWMFLWPKWIFFCFQCVFLLKISEKKTRQIIGAPAPSCSTMRKFRYNVETHLASSAMTDRMCVWKRGMNSIDYCFCCKYSSAGDIQESHHGLPAAM